MTLFNLQHRTSQSNVRNVNVRRFTQIKFDLVFISTLYSVIRHKNFYLEYFCIVRYNKILINYSGHRKFRVSLDLNYDPPLLGNHKLAIALITNSQVYIIELQRKLRLSYLIDWFIHWIVFYAVSATSQPYNGRVLIWNIYATVVAAHQSINTLSTIWLYQTLSPLKEWMVGRQVNRKARLGFQQTNLLW